MTSSAPCPAAPPTPPGRTPTPPATAPSARPAAQAEVPRLDDAAVALERIERHVLRARRLQAPLALVAVALGPVSTIDGLAAPQHAPALAHEFTRRLRARVREVDELWRQGDDEWIALLPGCRSEGARTARQRLVAALAAPYRLDSGLMCTLPRIGIACLGADGADAAALLARAQGALEFDPPVRSRRFD